MKKLIYSLTSALILLIGFNTPVSAQQNKAVIYMERIGREMNAIMVDSWDYTSEVAHGNSARKAETKRKELLRTSKVAIDRVSKMDGYAGSTQYRDSVIAFLQINYIVLNEDYSKILNMEEIAEQSYDNMEAYLLAQELASERLDLASDMLMDQQQIFATANNINLLESKDKVARKLEKSGGVINHYNEVYLIFFKSYKQEAYLLDAMIKKDVSAMEQNKNSLISMSADGLVKLKSVKAYNYDKSLIGAANTALDFFQKEASTKMATIIDFYMQEEKFNKIKASFDAKPQSKRTKDDITQYNTAVNEYNSKLNSFNKLNTELNNSRNAVLTNWDKTAKNFMDRHIPRYK
jgi:hypothetical protein